MSARTIHIRCVLAGLAALLIFTWGCRTGSSRSSKGSVVSLNRPHGYLEFVVRHRQDSREGTGPNASEEFKETILEQNLEIETNGYVYHPNLLEFSLAALFGLQSGDFEQITSSDRRSNCDDGEILEFDVSGTLLKKKSYPIHFYARRARSVAPRPFSASVETLSTTFGGVLQFVHETFPTTLSISQSVVDIDPYVKANDQPGRREDSELRFETAWLISEHSRLSLTYDHESIQEEPTGFDYETDNITIEHRLDFGNQRRHRLTSTLRYISQGGNFDNKQLRLSESLSLRHSSRLQSQYQLELADRQQAGVTGGDDIDERSYRVSASVEHHLYESLVTELSADYQEQDFSSGLIIQRWGVDLGLDYKKKNRWGVLRADFRTRFNRDDRVGSGLVGEVIDRRVVFNDPQPVVLREQAIEASSIVLVRDDRTELFQEGSDYRVVDFGIRIEIERIPTGRIPEGETVLLSYRFEIGGDFDLETSLKHISIRQDFHSGLTPFYKFEQEDQTLLPADATGVTPEDFTEHVVGLEYRRRPYRILAEYRDHDSTVSSFRALRLGLDYSHRLENGGTVSLSAKWSDFRYGSPTLRNTRFFNLVGRYVRAISPRLRVTSTLAYRNEKDSVTGDDEGIDLDIYLDWKVRQTTMRLTYSLGLFRDAFADQDAQVLFVQVRRKF